MYCRGIRRISLMLCFACCLCSLLFYNFSVAPVAFAHSSTSNYQNYLSQVSALGEKECVQPPQNVNLMTLSDAELSLYGLPTHQTLDRNPQRWSEQLSRAKYRTCGTYSGKIHHQYKPTKPSPVSNSTYEVNSDNWAGNVDTGNRGTYREAEATFTIPNEAPGESANMGAGASADDDASFWAGVGGDSFETSPAVVVQAGVDTQWTGFSQYNISWWEVYPGLTEQDLPLCNLATGSSVYVYITSNLNNEGYNYFYIENNSSLCYNSHVDRTAFSDSATGECIAERPTQSGGGYYGLADFGSVRFTGCYINSTPINSLPHIYHNLVSRQTGDTLATVGPVASNNTDYSVYWHNWY